jgi:hypothetical protein
MLARAGRARYSVSVFPELSIDPANGVLFERNLSMNYGNQVVTRLFVPESLVEMLRVPGFFNCFDK